MKVISVRGILSKGKSYIKIDAFYTNVATGKKHSNTRKEVIQMKKLLAILTVMVLCFSFIGCSKKDTKDETENQGNQSTNSNDVSDQGVNEEDALTDNESNESDSNDTDVKKPVDLKVAALKGPTAMGMVKLMEDAKEGNTASNQYEFTIAASADEITPLLVRGELDIAAVPANLAAVLYNNTEGAVRVIAINTLGVLYIVENGNTIQSVEDLRGKTIYSSGKGSTPEYALNYILEGYGIDPEKDVTIEFKSEHAECVAAITADPNGIALLPQPFVTTAQMSNENIRIALDLTKEWDTLQEGKEEKSALLTGVVVARKDFIEENKEALDLFLSQYEESVKYVNENTQDAATLIESNDIIKAAVAEKALPYCNITFIEGSDMKEKLSGYLAELYQQNPQAVGGTLPDEAFYYER